VIGGLIDSVRFFLMPLGLDCRTSGNVLASVVHYQTYCNMNEEETIAM